MFICIAFVTFNSVSILNGYLDQESKTVDKTVSN